MTGESLQHGGVRGSNRVVCELFGPSLLGPCEGTTLQTRWQTCRPKIPCNYLDIITYYGSISTGRIDEVLRAVRPRLTGHSASVVVTGALWGDKLRLRGSGGVN